MTRPRGVARVPKGSTRLIPSEIRTLAALARGLTTEEALEELGISKDTFNGCLRNIGYKQHSPNRASKVRAAYESQELPLPDALVAPEPISDEDRKLWIAVAVQPDPQAIANAVNLSRATARKRIAELMARFEAVTEPHLVTLGYAYGVLPAPAGAALAAR
ncbi:hypothetical protein OG612_44975 (plasmid) [Streptomyces sp. NBC_01527]|uniref:helix-turn-helix transcriptional regulator n=1 Tax=Streptomyces sp. NBC_01527 TaxID=2903894 RepID=UPI002F91618A